MAASSENTGKKPRGPGRRFQAGQSGNPAGRAKKTDEERDLEALCRERTPDALAVIERIMTSGENERNQLTAAQIIIERGYGKPRQAVEHSGSLEHVISAVQYVIVDPQKD